MFEDWLNEIWEDVVGKKLHWLKQVACGEFEDNRPIDVMVADALACCLPGVVLVASARDVVAITLRLIKHPEKREEVMEWILLIACTIPLILPVIGAAVGFLADGVGSVVGFLGGTELGATLRVVCLLLVRTTAKQLAPIIEVLSRFLKGDIVKILRGIKFAVYEAAMIKYLEQFGNGIINICKRVRLRLLELPGIDLVKATIKRLEQFEAGYYQFQKDAIKNIPKALNELDARLAKVLEETLAIDSHAASAGVHAPLPVPHTPPKQVVHASPGNPLHQLADDAAHAKPKPIGPAGAPHVEPVTPKVEPKPEVKPKAKAKPKTKAEIKTKADPVSRPQPETANVHESKAGKTAAMLDKERITQLSKEADAAKKSGNEALATAKIEEARSVLRPYLPKPGESDWSQVIDRLDVSSPPDKAYFWSGSREGAHLKAEELADSVGGVRLESTAGGRIVDGWSEVNDLPWNADKGGTPPFSGELWGNLSGKYASGASGEVNTIQSAASYARGGGPTWLKDELPVLNKSLANETVSKINVWQLDPDGSLTLVNVLE